MLRPYLDGLIGFNYLSTNTRVKSRNCIFCSSVASSNIINGLTLSCGAGGGLMIQVYSKKGNKRRHPFVVYIDLGVRYLKGERAKYLKEGSIHLEDGLVLYDISRSTTDLITTHIGISFAF